MKILQLVQKYGGTGALGTDPVIRDDQLLLCQAKHDVVLAFGERGSDARGVGEAKECFVPELGRSLRQDEGHASRLTAVIESDQPDIVHLHLIPPLGDLSTVARISERLPTVYTVHHHFLTCPSILRLLRANLRTCDDRAGLKCALNTYLYHCGPRGLNRLLNNWALFFDHRRAVSGIRKFIVLSRYMADRLVEAGFPRRKVSIVSPSYSYLGTVKASPIVSENTILYVGRVHFVKGVQLLIQASRHIVSDHRIVVAGDGAYLPRIKALASDTDVSKRVTFLGWVSREELPALYNQATVVVVPSVWPEPFGLVGLEAMAHARPVVAFNVGGIPMWLRDGHNGLLARPADVVDLARKIDLFLQNRTLAEEMGRRGRELLETDFSPQKHLEDLLRVYEEAQATF